MMVSMSAPATAPSRFGPEPVPPPRPPSSWPLPLAAAFLAVVAVVAVATWVVGAGDGAGTDVPLLLGPGVSDDFTRDEDPGPLGDARTGQRWDQVSGRWSVRDGHAVVVEPNQAGQRTVAVVDLGAADGAVSVTASAMVSGFGLAFRYQDPFNYWFLTSAPGYGTWKLQRLDDGEVVEVGPIGLAQAVDGTTVEVRFSGRTITVLIDGSPARQFTDPALEDAAGVGILVEGAGALDASWDDFIAVPAGGTPSATVDAS